MSTTTTVKSIYDHCIEKKINTTQEFFKLINGKKLRVIPGKNATKSGHNLPKVFTVPINYTNGWTTGQMNPGELLVLSSLVPTKSGIYLHELTFDVHTLDELETELVELNDSCKKLENKIELLKELGLTEYDEKIIKVVQLMDVFEPKKGAKYNKLEQAQKFVEALES